jgi:hypothetical protein
MAVKMEVSGVTHVQDHQGEVAAMDPVEVEMEASVAQVDSALVPDGRVATGVALQAVRSVDLLAQVEVRRVLDLMAIRDRKARTGTAGQAVQALDSPSVTGRTWISTLLVMERTGIPVAAAVVVVVAAVVTVSAIHMVEAAAAAAAEEEAEQVAMVARLVAPRLAF